MRDSVPYGNWTMPINFKRTETGGSCAPGCHKAFAYDRNNPVLITPPSTTQPAAAAPPVASDGKEKQP